MDLVVYLNENNTLDYTKSESYLIKIKEHSDSLFFGSEFYLLEGKIESDPDKNLSKKSLSVKYRRGYTFEEIYLDLAIQIYAKQKNKPDFTEFLAKDNNFVYAAKIVEKAAKKFSKDKNRIVTPYEIFHLRENFEEAYKNKKIKKILDKLPKMTKTMHIE